MSDKNEDMRTEGMHQALIGLFIIFISAVLIILGIRALRNND